MELVQMDLVINIITNILKKNSPYYFPSWIRIKERKWKRIRIHDPASAYGNTVEQSLHKSNQTSPAQDTEGTGSDASWWWPSCPGRPSSAACTCTSCPRTWGASRSPWTRCRSGGGPCWSAPKPACNDPAHKWKYLNTFVVRCKKFSLSKG